MPSPSTSTISSRRDRARMNFHSRKIVFFLLLFEISRIENLKEEEKEKEYSGEYGKRILLDFDTPASKISRLSRVCNVRLSRHAFFFFFFFFSPPESRLLPDSFFTRECVFAPIRGDRPAITVNRPPSLPSPSPSPHFSGQKISKQAADND